MSIPQRLYRIARHKLTDLKDRIEALDEETSAPSQTPPPGPDMAKPKPDASRELNDAIAAPLPPSAPPPRDANRSASGAGSSYTGSGSLSRTSGASGSVSTAGGANGGTQANAAPDPLAYHYRLLGVEPGADFQTVQSRYNDYAARADASKFPAGSDEANTAQEIRRRLDESFRILKDALDETSRRFHQLGIVNAVQFFLFGNAACAKDEILWRNALA